MACLEENELAAHLGGRLAAREQARVMAHLDACGACSDLATALARVYPMSAIPASTVSVRPFSSPHATTELGIGPPDAVGRYILLSPVGAGGMGVVFAAYDPKLDRKVAVKVLRRAGDASNGSREGLMMREARTMAKLSHPNVLAIHDVGTHEGHVFLVEDFVDGGTLRSWLHEEKRSTEQVLSVLVLAGRGLSAAHVAGLVHRDFKPDNVLIANDGRVLVADFGLTRAAPSVEGVHAGSATPAGTPAYMAPEATRERRFDARSDQYSFCATLHEALFGELPAPAEGAQVKSSVASEVPEALRAALRRGLARDPADRFPSIDALLAALSAHPSRLGPSRRARAAAALSLAAIAAIGAFASSRRTADAPAPIPVVPPAAAASAPPDTHAEARAVATLPVTPAPAASGAAPRNISSRARKPPAPPEPAVVSSSEPPPPTPSDPLWRRY